MLIRFLIAKTENSPICHRALTVGIYRFDVKKRVRLVDYVMMTHEGFILTTYVLVGAAMSYTIVTGCLELAEKLNHELRA